MSYPKFHQPGIVLIAGAILTTITLLASVTVFAVMARNAETLLNKSLRLSLESRVQLTETEIGTAFKRTELIATHQLLIDLLELVDVGADGTAAQNNLNLAAQTFVGKELTAIAVYGEDGQVLTRTGVFAQQSELAVSLNNFPGYVQLIWDGQLLLRAIVEVKQDGLVVGKVMTESPLPAIMGTIMDANRLGETGELALCAPFGLKMKCFPTTLSPKVLISSQRTPDGVQLPMAHALEGDTGFIKTKDYRNQEVAAAYAPVGNLGLGMVLKIDSAELHAPVWSQLRYLIPLLAGVLIIALLLLRWRLSPLVLKLVRAETKAAERATALTEEVAERKDAEKASRGFRKTLDLSTDGIRMFWPDTLEYFYSNQASLNMIGLTEEEFIGSTPAEVNLSLDEEQFRQTCDLLVSGKEKSITYQEDFVNRNGEQMPLKVFLEYITPEHEKPRFVAVARDITERKAADLQIARLKSTLDSIEDPVYMFWPDTLEYFYVNQAAVDFSGISKEDILGHTPNELFTYFDLNEFYERSEALYSGKLTALTYEIQLANHHGEMVQVEILSQIIKPKGEKAHFVEIFRDITERKAVDKAKSEFVSTVSHELRTPLTAIKGVLGLIKAGAFDKSPEKLQSMVNIAYSNSDRLHKLIDGILDIEKLEAGKMSFQMRPTDLEPLLEEAVAANEGYGAEYGVTFFCSGIEEPLFVNADPDRLMQVMGNLLSNAAKFSPRGGQVEVSLARHGGSLRVAVKDYGSGIPEAVQETIFEKFTQADASDQRQQGGTGLGLSIAKRIVEEHDGRIGFTTEVGKGTTFYVDLPELEVEAGMSTAERSVGEDASHLLIVEDDPDVSHLLEYILQNGGYRTSVAGTARQAKELLAVETFDGMTLDITLPGQNGISLLKELREQPETHDLPVVIFSANEEAREMAEFVQAVLVKSQISNQGILQAIQAVIGVKRTAKSETDGKVL